MQHSQRGQAIVLIALLMAVLIGFAGLAIDSARAFDSRRILQDATDAAALAAADSYQAGAPTGWQAAETTALHLFEVDNRLYAGESCVPGIFSIPSVGGAAVVTTCTMAGGSGTSLTFTATDLGPAGQTFKLDAQRPLTLALMQVLTATSSLTLLASATAVANDQSQTPALGGLSTDSSCPGGSGTTSPIHIEMRSNTAAVYGDIVSNGVLEMGGLSYVNVTGDALTRCAPPINADHLQYQGYQCRTQFLTPPCSSSGSISGRLRSTANHLADPGFAPPTSVGGGSPAAVNWLPGTYSIDPRFGNSSATCYFLGSGVYEWQGGLTVSGGIVSNELRPPAEPAPAPRFWSTNGVNCDGDFTVLSASSPGNGIAATGTWSVKVTAQRDQAGVATRESAPSICQQVSVSGSNAAFTINIKNVPGATSYNVYAVAPPPIGSGTCAGQFGWVANINNANYAGEVQGNLKTAQNSPTVIDSNSIGSGWAPNILAPPRSSGAFPPDPEAANPFGGSLPGLSPNRGLQANKGDRADENFCVTSGGSPTVCPVPGAKRATLDFATPGAVEMYVTQGTCINVNAGDAFLFSGYQYDWILDYEPATPLPACSAGNNWNGVTNSAAIGLTYTPQAAFNITGDGGSNNDTWSLEGPTGGILAASIHIQHATGLIVDFDPRYAPSPGGARLIG